MANAYGILGNENPGAVSTDLYTAPASTEAVGTVFVANRHASTAKLARVSLAPLGVALDVDQYIIFDVSIPASDTLILNGISLKATDKIRVFATDAEVTFVFTAVEIT
jgi:hypothetical protein